MKKVLTGVCIALACVVVGLVIYLAIPKDNTELVLDTTGAETTFIVGEAFSADGLKVYEKEGDTQTEIADYTITHEYDPNTAGTYIITISYGGLEKSYTVSVVSVSLQTIEADTSAARVEFALGESFSSEGLVVKANYESDITRVVTDYAVNSDAYDSSTAGQKTITITYGEKSITYNVTVIDPFDTAETALDEDNFVLTGQNSATSSIEASRNGNEMNIISYNTDQEITSRAWEFLTENERYEVQYTDGAVSGFQKGASTFATMGLDVLIPQQAFTFVSMNRTADGLVYVYDYTAGNSRYTYTLDSQNRVVGVVVVDTESQSTTQSYTISYETPTIPQIAKWGNGQTLELETSGAQTTFYLGDTFTAEGLVATVVDGENRYDVSNLIMVNSSNFVNTAEDTYQITVTYGDIQQTYEVTVASPFTQAETALETQDFTLTMAPIGNDIGYNYRVGNTIYSTNLDPNEIMTLQAWEYIDANELYRITYTDGEPTRYEKGTSTFLTGIAQVLPLPTYTLQSAVVTEGNRVITYYYADTQLTTVYTLDSQNRIINVLATRDDETVQEINVTYGTPTISIPELPSDVVWQE